MTMSRLGSAKSMSVTAVHHEQQDEQDRSTPLSAASVSCSTWVISSMHCTVSQQVYTRSQQVISCVVTRHVVGAQPLIRVSTAHSMLCILQHFRFLVFLGFLDFSSEFFQHSIKIKIPKILKKNKNQKY